MEIMDCDICGGAFLEDHGKCTCDEKKIKKLKKVIKAQQNLLVCYRTGKRPTEKDLDILDKYND